MRRAVLIVVFLAAVMLGVPLGTFALGSSRAERSEPPESTTGPEEPGDAITVFLAEENRVEEIDLTDYLVGVLAAEMPVSAPPEALKAQAAVSLTLARYMQKGGAKADLLVRPRAAPGVFHRGDAKGTLRRGFRGDRRKAPRGRRSRAGRDDRV